MTEANGADLGAAPTPGTEVAPLMLGMGWFPDEPGGLDRYFRDLHTALGAPSAVVVGPAAAPPASVRVASHRARPLPRRLAGYALTAHRAAGEASLVDGHFALYALAALGSRRVRRLPRLMHFHGPWADESRAGGTRPLVVAAKRLIERRTYRGARHTIVLSEAFRRVLVENYGIPPWRISVIPPGVDLARFSPGDGRDRQRLGVSEDAWVAVAARRLVPRMGLDVLLRAWANVVVAAPRPAVLVVVGDGPERAGLEALTEELGIGASVRFPGRVSDADLAAWYRAADVAVTPSVALEGFGLVVLEALACGTPPIVTSVGGLPEAVDGLGHSLVVPPSDPAALAARLRGAREGTAPLPSPERCRAHAARFGWPEVASRHRRLYARVAAPAPRTRPRVVFLDHCAELSGGELALARTIPALAGVDAHVILAQDGPLVPLLRRAGISVEVMVMSEGARGLGRARVALGALPLGAVAGSAAHIAALARRLRRLRPDIVHTNSLKAAVYGSAAAKIAGIPLVWHLHDRLAPDYLPTAAIRLLRCVARTAPSAIIANSETTRAELPSVPCPVEVIPPPVAPAPAAPAARVGGPSAPRTFRVGLVGRIAPWKGQHLFIEAFARAFPGGAEEAVLVGAPLFGEERYEHELRETADRLGLDGRVRFRGFRDDVPAELARLDVLVHASTIPEPFGQAILEGMAAGLPVVVPDAGGPAEVVADGRDGLHYRLGDPDALAGALRRLRHDDRLRQELAAAAPAALGRFAPEVVGPRIEALYGRVLRSRHAAPGRR